MTEREMLMARISQTKKALETVPAFMALNRESMEDEIQRLTERLGALEDTPEPFQTTITFSGPKVEDRRGIRADFAVVAIPKYLTAVKTTGKELASIQRDRANRFDMLITGVARGSFGFTLEVFTDKERAEEDDALLRAAVDRINDVLTAAEKDDDLVAEVLADLSSTTVEALHSFAKFLSDNECQCCISTRDKKCPVSDFISVEKRLNRSNITTSEEVVTGRFRAIAPGRRYFEFRTVSGECIDGKISKDAGDIEEWNLRFSVHSTRIRVETRQVGTGSKSYLIRDTPELLTQETD